VTRVFLFGINVFSLFLIRCIDSLHLYHTHQLTSTTTTFSSMAQIATPPSGGTSPTPTTPSSSTATSLTKRDQTSSPVDSLKSKSPTKPRLKKRVYVVGVILVGLFLLAVIQEGVGGLVTVAVALVLLRTLWWLLSVLVLNRFPFFNTMCNVLFQLTAADSTPPPKKTHIKFV
jgi:hypothetical protein